MHIARECRHLCQLHACRYSVVESDARGGAARKYRTISYYLCGVHVGLIGKYVKVDKERCRRACF